MSELDISVNKKIIIKKFYVLKDRPWRLGSSSIDIYLEFSDVSSTSVSHLRALFFAFIECWKEAGNIMGEVQRLEHLYASRVGEYGFTIEIQ
jgi:hypothetical protein